jgi:hypothetical protein
LKLTSTKAYRVVQYVLVNTEFTQREVTRKTSVGLGHVNEVINYMVSIGVVGRSEKGYVLRDPVRLLEKISFDRPLNSVEVSRFRLPTTTIDETEKMVAAKLAAIGTGYAFTVFSGLRRYFEYHISYPMVHLYVGDDSALGHLEPGEGPVQVVALRPDIEGILEDSVEIGGVKVCSREQVIIDLFSSGVGRDAAIKFLEAI